MVSTGMLRQLEATQPYRGDVRELLDETRETPWKSVAIMSHSMYESFLTKLGRLNGNQWQS